MLRLGVDSCVVIAARHDDDTHHRPCRELFDQAAVGWVELLVSSTFDYDQEIGWERNPERAAGNVDWLAAEQATRIAGPFTVGVTRLGCDVLIGDDHKVLYEQLSSEFGATSAGDSSYRRKAFDVHHCQAAILAAADAFVTTDSRGILRRLQKATQGAVPRPLISPEQAGEMVAGSGT